MLYQSKLVVLNSLSTFLRIALVQADNLSPMTGNVANRSNAFDVSFMKNAFPTPEAYYAFERLLQFSSESIENRQVPRAWEPMVSNDDDVVDHFTQHFPMTENTLGGAWSLQELDTVKEVTYAKGNTNDSRPALVNFVAVSNFLFAVNQHLRSQHHFTSILLLHCIQRSLKRILTARHLCLHLV
jgi:hypothetical protein